MFQLTLAETDEASRLVSQSVTPSPATRRTHHDCDQPRKHRGRVYLPMPSPNRASPCSPASCARPGRSRSTSPSCALSFSCAASWTPIAIWLAQIDSIEKKYDEQFRVVFDAIKRLVAEDEARKSTPRREIGFHIKEDAHPLSCPKREATMNPEQFLQRHPRPSFTMPSPARDWRKTTIPELRLPHPVPQRRLFEPLYGYKWENTEILMPDTVFSNAEPTGEKGETGSGILDVFDRYNFTVNEAEPLEKEVVVDPEMLGKVFENLLPENIRHAGGTYYTPGSLSTTCASRRCCTTSPREPLPFPRMILRCSSGWRNASPILRPRKPKPTPTNDCPKASARTPGCSTICSRRLRFATRHRLGRVPRRHDA